MPRSARSCRDECVEKDDESVWSTSQLCGTSPLHFALEHLAASPPAGIPFVFEPKQTPKRKVVQLDRVVRSGEDVGDEFGRLAFADQTISALPRHMVEGDDRRLGG